jgi:diacylglycerol kinase family enzyme
VQARIVLNRASGSVGRPDAGDLVRRFGAQGVEAQADVVSGTAVASAVRAGLAARADVIVVAGGDGTASAAAAAMVGQECPLAVLPFGTMNHFARDLGMPRDIDGAVAAIAAGLVRTVDVGEVNGHVFLNNSSLGIYPDLVVRRELEQIESARGRWSSAASALMQVVRRLPLHDVRIATRTRVLTQRTPFVFIGNNDYGLKFPWSSARDRLDGGELSLYVARCQGVGDLLRLAARATLGLLEGAESLDVAHSPVILVAPLCARVRVSLDGEVLHLLAPLRYRILPRALRVIAPRPVAARARPAKQAEQPSARPSTRQQAD